MRDERVRPRLDQVAELTRGVRLPLAPIKDEHIEILAEGLRHAFHYVRTHAPNTVSSGGEPEVTALMQARLNQADSGGPSLAATRPLGRTWIGEHQFRRVSP